MVSSANSCPKLWPAADACSAANSGHRTMSPNMDGPGSGASGRPPGSSSSMGKLITSVGPGKSIQRMCRSAIAAVSNSTIDNSAAGLTSILAMTNLATLINSDSETSYPDSLATSMLTALSPAMTDARRSPRRAIHRQLGRFVFGVSVHDFSDQSMPDHISTGQLGDMDVVDTLEDIDRGPQPRPVAAWQVDLRNIASNNDFGAESQSGEEHFH